MVDEVEEIGTISPPLFSGNMQERQLSITNLNRLQSAFHNRTIYDNDKNLIELDYSHSKIKRIEPYLTIKLNLSNLVTLTLDNNEIIEIGEDFPYLPSLERFYMNNNNISNLDLFLIRIRYACPKLMYLSLIGNSCCTLDEQYRYKIISELPTLIFLDTSGIKDEERKKVKELYGIHTGVEEDSDDSTDSNDGFDSHDEADEIMKQIMKAKQKLETQKQKVETLKQESVNSQKKAKITNRANESIEFFHQSQKDYNFSKNQLLLMDQIKLSLDMMEAPADVSLIDRNLDILQRLVEIFEDEKNDIAKHIEITRKTREKMQREEEARLERKKITDEYLRLENFERERIMRKMQQAKELSFEQKVDAKRAEDDFSFALLEEESLRVVPEEPLSDDFIQARFKEHLKVIYD
jgi:hypothetical protein